MTENEFLLEDRIAKIQAINNQYDLEHNAYLSFSGGKDSTVLHYLLDMALPNNKIPRVYLNTGIEYKDMVKFVKDLAKKDNRIIVYNSGVNIKQMLDTYGYPFKSKQHSHNWLLYNKNKNKIQEYIDLVENDKNLLKDYNFIHNLPSGVKTSIKYIYGVRERERDNKCYEYIDLP